MKTKNIQEINSAFQQYFRTSKRIRIHNRKGVFIVVDDREEAVDLVRKLFVSKGENQEIVSSNTVSGAKREIECHNNGKGVKAIVIDLGLEGNGEDADGVCLANWLNDNYPDIPFIFSTGREKRSKELEKEFPGVDIFIKGKHSLNDFAEALGLNVDNGTPRESEVIIPEDNVKYEEKGRGVFSFVRSFFSL